MDTLKAPSLQSLLESDRGSTDSLLAESMQLDIDELDDAEYLIPPLDSLPTLESVLSELDGDLDSMSDGGLLVPTPTPSMSDNYRAGSILRHVYLQGVSSQIGSAVDRVNAGLATSVAIANMIAVGTSHGHILAFDLSQTLRWCCQDHIAQGAVAALGFNDDTSRLIAGFARGFIVMINTASGDTMRILSDAITPNTGVLHLKWTSKTALALCLDSGGSVWSLSFTRKLGIRGCDSRCLFSGARGEVCSVEPLLFNEENHSLRSYCVVALATLSKFFVVLIRPRLKVVKYQTMTGPVECLPLLAWQMVLIQAADTSRAVEPVLAAARGNHIYFHQITCINGKVNLLFLRHVTVGYNLLALHWLGPKSLGHLDTSEVLHLTDVRSNKELECIDMATAGLVYASAQFKGIATGGNVSPALALAGTYACYNSIVSRGTQLYVLGGRSLRAVSVRTWTDRLTHLTNNQRWLEAVDLAMDGFRTAQRKPRRLTFARERVLQLIDDYLAATTRCPEICLGAIIECVIEINEMHLLWQELWDRLDSTESYLNFITEHINKERIMRDISPSVSQALLSYWAKKRPQTVEDIILKIDWHSLDLHQALTITRQHRLYRAQMHLNTKALGDYTISLVELIPLVEQDEVLGNHLLVYISSSLGGRGYPNGEITVDQVPQVKHEVLRCLTNIHSINASDSELPYPYLRTMLQFNIRETLNVLSLAFQEREFAGDLGQSRRQRIVDILLEIITPDTFEFSKISTLIYFICQQMASRCLAEDESQLARIIGHLATEQADESAREHAEREQAWLELINADSLKHISVSELMRLTKAAKCFRVLEHLLEQTKRFEQIFDCYLLDQHRHFDLFIYMHRHANNASRKVYAQLLRHFETVIEINVQQLTRVVMAYYHPRINELIRLVDKKPNALYAFLAELLKQGYPLDPVDCELYVDLLCQNHPDMVEQFLQTSDLYRIENTLHIVKSYNLHSALVYLYAKQGDYEAAFNILLNKLGEAPENVAEEAALAVSGLCTRASLAANLPTADIEKLWFRLLTIILARIDLASITRQILLAAGAHVDLSSLVQLVLNSGTQTGNFGDIKDILVGMLSNSKHEILALNSAADILGNDLHFRFAEAKAKASQGLCVKSIKCVVCRARLFQPVTQVIVFGVCGHAVHETCVRPELSEDVHLRCPRCDVGIVETASIVLSQPTLFRNQNSIAGNANGGPTSLLRMQINVPPRIGIRKKS